MSEQQKKDEIILLNVGGKRHSVYKSTLLTYPDTLLARMILSPVGILKIIIF